MAILEAEFAVTENQLDLDKKRLSLQEKLGGLGKGEDKTQAIIDLENEIEDLLSSIKDNEEVSESSSSNTESFVLEKIKD